MQTAKERKKDRDDFQAVHNGYFSGLSDVCGLASSFHSAMVSILNIHFIKRKYRLNTTRKPSN